MSEVGAITPMRETRNLGLYKIVVENPEGKPYY
jgi:hypothetical protein